ncbi:MAG: hypothetical protein Q8898_04480 [Bacillota bacterium]|nr:hypothetical protein [Bacillota bacterium]
MRWIDLSNYSPSGKWLEKAKRATEMLIAAKTKDERKTIINENSDIWKEIKDDLLQLSKGKCWYTEAKELVSHYHVDHFRPKNNVKKYENGQNETINIDDGYWWLAFDWKNYRIAGATSNSANLDEEGICRGKQDYFPIRKDSYCANTPDCDLSKEMYYALLDPTVKNDLIYLAFDETGMPFSTALKGTWEYERVQITIFLLHLDSPQLVDERKKIWNKCKMLTNEVAHIMSSRGEVSHEIIEQSLTDKLNELRNLASFESQLSSTAICYLLNSEYDWAKRIASNA